MGDDVKDCSPVGDAEASRCAHLEPEPSATWNTDRSEKIGKQVLAPGTDGDSDGMILRHVAIAVSPNCIIRRRTIASRPTTRRFRRRYRLQHSLWRKCATRPNSPVFSARCSICSVCREKAAPGAHWPCPLLKSAVEAFRLLEERRSVGKVVIRR